MRLGLGLWLLLATSACGNAERLTREQAAIFAGEAAPDDTAVVAVVNFAGGQCSGSLIAPRLVLTARHCVAATADKDLQVVCGHNMFQPPDSPGAIFVVPLPKISEDPNDYLAVSEIRMPDGLGDDLCGTDVVLLRLQDALSGIAPLALRLDQPVQADETYSAVGFGIDDSLADRPSGVRKRGDGYLVKCAGAACGLQDVFDNEWVGNSGPCSGDSGGPALDVDGKLIGVVSRGKTGCVDPVFSDVATRADWLTSELLAAAEPAPTPAATAKANGPAETCSLTRAPAVGFLGWSMLLGGALGLARRRNVMRVRRARRIGRPRSRGRGTGPHGLW